ADRCGAGIDLSDVGGDGDALGDLSDLESKIHAEALQRGQNDMILLDSAKSVAAGDDAVRSGCKLRYEVIAAGTGNHGLGFVGRFVRGGDVCAGDGSLGGIAYDPGDFSRGSLREDTRSHGERETQYFSHDFFKLRTVEETLYLRMARV